MLFLGPLIASQQALALLSNAAHGGDGSRDRLTPGMSAQGMPCRLSILVPERRQLGASVEAHGPASFAAHLLRRHVRNFLLNARFQMGALLARKSLASFCSQTAARIFGVFT